jgi:hypothetical protein
LSAIGVADAARNNAAWCSAVCGAHGDPGEFSEAYWRSRAAAPAYYPNLVTFVPESALVISAVREFDRARPSASWAVKDSFGTLPLERTGFRALLEAEWIVRPASARRALQSACWSRVEKESELAAWESAWGQSAGQARVFLPALLRRDEIAILAARAGDGEIVAGVVANRAANAVGLTNLFVRGAAGKATRGDCVDAAAAVFPGLPLVGYESGKDLADSRALGFSSLGSLRVWVKRVSVLAALAP